MAPQRSSSAARRWNADNMPQGDSAVELLPSPSATVSSERFGNDYKQNDDGAFVNVRRESTFSFGATTIAGGDLNKTATDLPLVKTTTRPRKLRRWTGAKTFAAIVDVILCLVPVSFLVLAGLVGQLEGKPVDEYGTHIQRWSLLGPTIFPIFFAAIVGRTMKFVAQWKLEQGTRLQTLEKLIGSQSVFGAVNTQVMLQHFSLLSIGIILIWCFSPLGGQASLRILGTGYVLSSNTTELAYLNMTNQLSGFQAAYSVSQSIYAINSIFTGCLMGPETSKNGSEDVWGNIKIPQIEALSTTADGDGWKAVPSNATYTSLLGVPVAGVPSDTNTSYVLKSYYYNMECSTLEVVQTVGDWLTPLGIIPSDTSYGVNTTDIFDASKGFTTFYMNSFTNYTEERANGTDKSPFNIYMVSRSGVNNTGTAGGSLNATFANCSMTPTFVQSAVNCSTSIAGTTGSKCSVSKMRLDPDPDNTPSFSYNSKIPLVVPGEIFTLFSENLREVATSGSSFGSTPIEQYLSGQIYFPFAFGDTLVQLYQTSISDFTTRFGQIINTYWLASLAPEASTGNLKLATVADLLAGNSTLAANFFKPAMNSTIATISQLEEVYTCNKGWLAGLIMASIIMLVLGVGGTILKYLSVGPDVLGYVSMLVDSPWVSADVASHMDGLEKTRSLKDMKLRMEDVRDGEQVGRIAVTSVQGRANNGRRLKPYRLYI